MILNSQEMRQLDQLVTEREGQACENAGSWHRTPPLSLAALLDRRRRQLAGRLD